MHFMNKQREAHMSGKAPGGHADEAEGGHEGHASAAHLPSIHIHSHAKGHTVHILHKDGRHEKHEHEAGDASGMAEHLQNHLAAGGGEGQDHGFSSDEGMEDEMGSGPGV